MAETYARRIDGFRIERRQHEYSDLLPLVLRSAVHGTILPGRFRQPWSKRLVLIKWVIKGKAVISVAGRRIPFGPGEVAVHVPSQPHQFWAVEPENEMCWFSVDGPLVEQFAHLLGLRGGVYPYDRPPVEKISELARSLDDQTLEGFRRSSLMAIELMYEVARQLPPPQASSVVHQVRHLIRENLADPDLSAQRLASELHYNRTALSRLFHQQTGMTIMDCITQTRLQEAELLLGQTDDTIGAVARKCGFRDPSYFARWVRKHTGRLPRMMRAAMSELPPDTAGRLHG